MILNGFRRGLVSPAKWPADYRFGGGRLSRARPCGGRTCSSCYLGLKLDEAEKLVDRFTLELVSSVISLSLDTRVLILHAAADTLGVQLNPDDTQIEESVRDFRAFMSLTADPLSGKCRSRRKLFEQFTSWGRYCEIGPTRCNIVCELEIDLRVSSSEAMGWRS